MSWLFIEKVIRITLGITLGAWVARYLGPADFGVLNFANSFVSILSAIAILGLNDIIIREVLKNEKQMGSILGTAFILKVLGSFTLLASVYAIIHIFNYPYETQVIILIFASSFFFQSFSVIDCYFKSQVLSQYVVLANLLSLIICSTLRIILILYKQPLIYFAIVDFIDFFLRTLFQIIFFTWKKDFFKGWVFSFSTAKKLLLQSWPLILTGIIINIDTRIDQVMLGKIIGTQATGYYAAASKISESIFWFFDVLAVSLFPAIVNAKGKSNTKYMARTQLFFTFMTLFFIASCVPIIIFSKTIIHFLYGSQYSISSEILKINAICGFFVVMKCAQTRWAIVENLQAYNLLVQLIGSLCNVLLNFILIKKIGIMGAAYGTLLAHVISLTIITGSVKSMRPSLFLMANGIMNILNLKFLQWRSFIWPDK